MIDLSDESYTHERQQCAGHYVTDGQNGIHRRYQRRIEMGMIEGSEEYHLRKYRLIGALKNNWLGINLKVGRSFLAEATRISLGRDGKWWMVKEHGMILYLQKIMENLRIVCIRYSRTGPWEDFDN